MNIPYRLHHSIIHSLTRHFLLSTPTIHHSTNSPIPRPRAGILHLPSLRRLRTPFQSSRHTRTVRPTIFLVPHQYLIPPLENADIIFKTRIHCNLPSYQGCQLGIGRLLRMPTSFSKVTARTVSEPLSVFGCRARMVQSAVAQTCADHAGQACSGGQGRGEAV